MKTLEQEIREQIVIDQMHSSDIPIVRPQRVGDIGGIQIFRRFNKYQGRVVHFGHSVLIAFKMTDFDKVLTRMIKALAYFETVEDLSELPKRYQRYKPIRPKTTDPDQMMEALFWAERRGLRFFKSDGGRAAAGFYGNAPDCFARAICHHVGAEYREVYDTIYHGDIKNRPSDFVQIGLEKYGLRVVWSDYLVTKKATEWQREALGLNEQWVWKRISASKAYKVFGDCIIRQHSHAAAIQDGVLLDTFDSRRHKVQMVYKRCSEEEMLELRAKAAICIDS